MDGVTLQSRLWKGYGKAALRIGTSHGVYRPVDNTNPLISGNLIETIPAVFAIHVAQYNFDKPSDYKDCLFHGLFDASNVHKWDYFSGAPSVNSTDGVYFVTGFDPLKPILCVQCTRVFSLARSGAVTAAVLTMPVNLANMPDQFASGGSSILFSGYPGGMLMRRIITSISADFPSDSGAGIYEVFLPAVGGVLPQPWDVLTDDLGRGYLVRTCEVSDLGWRMLVAEEPSLSTSGSGAGSATGLFMYPRTIDVHRPKTQAIASGPNVATLKTYTGTTTDTSTPTGEDIIFTGLPAGIQFVSPLSRGAGSTLPSDTHAPGVYTIFIPLASAALGTIFNRDVIVDDLGNRYQVEDAYFTPLGFKLRARLLEI